MTKRIEYIDAMRGFTMILVVFSHVLLFSFKSNPSFSFNDIFILFRMPLFFFLSGFLVFKSNFVEDGKSLGSFLVKKFKAQIIPTVIFISLYSILFNKEFVPIWLSASKNGYWFTWVLFFYFVIFSVTFYVLRRNPLKAKMLWGGVIAILVYITALLLEHIHLPKIPYTISEFLSVGSFRYFIFFFFGAIVRWKFDSFTKLMDGKVAPTVAIILFIVFQIFIYGVLGTDIVGRIISSFLRLLLGFIGVFIVFTFFRRYQDLFTKDKKCGRFLQYVGERTLDVYLIHYLIIPTQLAMIGDFLTKFNNPLLELFLGLLIALLIVVACLIISNIVRISDYLAKWCFGKVISNK